MFGLTTQELRELKRLNTPHKIQDFLDTIAINLEKNGETCMSPRRVLRERKAHCIEAAFLAGAALWLNGERPLILSLKVVEKKGDYDHIVALYKQNGYWGAISKTNHSVLRFRDPIYRTIRELALSYFHEYFLITTGKKTLRGYSRPINLKHFGIEWITRDDDLWDIAETIYDMPHRTFVSESNLRHIRQAHPLERKAASIAEWQKRDMRT